MRKAIVATKILAKSLAIVLIVAIVLVAVTPQGRAGASAVLFALQVIPAVPVKPLTWFNSEPERRSVTFAGANGSVQADLYVPNGDEPFEGLLLFLGVNPAGRDDTRVVNLASGLARTGRVVMIPWSDDMASKRIVVDEIHNLVYAFEYLASLDFVAADRVGMAGFCVGASFATVAAENPRIADRVRYVNFFGGYYDALDLVKSVVTRTRSYEGVVKSWDPDPLAVEVVRVHLIAGVSDTAERRLLEKVFLQGSSVTRDQIDGLSSSGKVVFNLLLGSESEDVVIDQLIANLPPSVLESLRQISPSNGIDRLKADLLIMHDREDNLVPAYESRRLFDQVKGRGNVSYTEFSFFSHVDPTEPVGLTGLLTEGFKLFKHLYRMFRAA